MLAGASTAPRHRFGQNFMIDRNLVTLVAEAGQIAATDLVIEVGPGTGTLTEELLSPAHGMSLPSRSTVTWRLCSASTLPAGPDFASSRAMLSPANTS